MEEKKELGFFGRFMENHPVLTVVTFRWSSEKLWIMSRAVKSKTNTGTSRNVRYLFQDIKLIELKTTRI